jgi:hypothetical protein
LLINKTNIYVLIVAIKIIEKNIKQYIDKMEVSDYINSITDGYTTVYPENTHI